MVIDKKSHKIICTAFTQGRKHDFRLFKESNLKIHPRIKSLIDTGYQGLQKIHYRANLPKKKTKKRQLTAQEKEQNRQLARERVLNENIIGRIKRFKIISERYRNRRKRFCLRFNLISAIYNLELDFPWVSKEVY